MLNSSTHDMLICVFKGNSPDKQYCECSLGGFDLEICLESLVVLVREGWELEQITLFDHLRAPVHLPIEAFDDQSLLIPISQLQAQWEELL